MSGLTSSKNTSTLLGMDPNLVDLRPRGGAGIGNANSANISSVITPFQKPHLTVISMLLREVQLIMKDQRTKRFLLLGVLNLACTMLLISFCRSTNSMALSAYTFLTVFDLLILLTCLISIWIEHQRPSPSYTFGYERYEVLAVFTTTIIVQLETLFIVKESFERLIEQPVVTRDRWLLGTTLAFTCHSVITYSTDSKAWCHVIASSSSSWLQEHMADISQSVCQIIPGLSRLLLPRLNPLILIAYTGGAVLFLANLLVEMKGYHIMDTIAAILISLMMSVTVFPMSIYAGKILLQTTPSHVIGQLDKCLREAATLDGVLEFRNEYFWTLSFGKLAGSLHVRVRRDANEQLVLAHLTDRLFNLVSELSIQVFKDDWSRKVTSLHMLNEASHRIPSPTHNGLQQIISPKQELSVPNHQIGTTPHLAITVHPNAIDVEKSVPTTV